MNNNLIMYADETRQLHTAGSLIIFGIEQFKRAKIITQLNILREYNNAVQDKLSYDKPALIQEFIWDYLIDCIRILIFFEGYMKAELIIRGFCVHIINRDGKAISLSLLANEQRKRPISLKEIHDIIPFFVDHESGMISHYGLKEITLGINVLLEPKYRDYYQFDDFTLATIKYFNRIRNKLHFNHEAEFQISPLFIERLDHLNKFVDKIIQQWIPKS